MTTIDSLQIEIQSNSASASQGIDAIADALGRLKEKGSVGVAVKNLNNLAGALKNLTPVASNANKLNALATAVEKLSSVGSFNKTITQLSKLPGALRVLSDLNIDGLESKFKSLASATSHLSSVKSGGLPTMINALAKINQVTDSLDEATIGRFAARVALLSEKLGPLSQKMTAITTGFRAINSAAKEAGKGVDSFGKDINTTTHNVSSFIQVMRGMLDVLRPVIEILKYSIGEAMEWDGIVYQFGNAFGEQAELYYNKITKISDALSINKQQFMENSAMSASMLIGFGVNRSDAREMALGYTELAYDIWAAYNNVYKNVDDAMTAVRSAISGEVEPIRRAGFTIVDSQLAMTAANHDIAYSSQTATEGLKSYLRYLTLIEQAHSKGIVGAYAQEMSTAEGLTRTLAQQVKSLAQAFGGLFLPILVRVIPWISALVQVLTAAIRTIAGFFGITLQEVNWKGFGAGATSGLGAVEESAEDAGGALGKAAKAAKELKNATLGIDELNVISPPDPNTGGGSGGGASAGVGGGGGLDVGSLWDDSIFAQVEEQTNAIKQKLKNLLPVIGGIAAAFGGWRLLNLIDDLDDSIKGVGKLKKVMSALGKTLIVAGISIAVGKLVWDFTGAYLENGNLSELGKALGTTVLGAAVAGWLTGGVGAGLVVMTSGVVTLTKLGIELKEGSIEITDPKAVITMLVGALETVLGGALIIDTLRGGKWVKGISSALFGGLKSAVGKIGWSAIGSTVTSYLSTALSAVGTALAGISGWAIAAVVAIVATLALAIVDYDFTEIGYKIGEAIGKACRKVADVAGDIGSSIMGGLKKAFAWVVTNFDINSIADLINLIFNPKMWIKKLIPKLVEIGIEVIPGIWEGIKKGWNNFWSNLDEFVDGFVDGFKKGFGIASPAKTMIPLGLEIVNGLWQGIKDSFSNVVKKLRGWCTDLINEAAKALKPSAIKEKLSLMWENAKNWWNTSKGVLKEYTPSIGSITNKIKDAWESARSWYNKKKANMADYTPNIGSIYAKVKSAWDTARSWYNNNKAKMADYTPNIGSIYQKVKSAWDTARSWYNNSKAQMSTYTPSIGSIKDKLVSAWNTAKSWWDKNVKLSIPSLSFKVTYTPKSSLGAVKKAIVNALGLEGWPKLSFAKNGGIFDAGSLIWAGEAGAEVVANAGGGKTGVMNVQQMQEAVYEGVYAAVIAAMGHSGNSGGQAVNVYLDGRQITSTVEKRQRERGATLMGNQVYSYG